VELLAGLLYGNSSSSSSSTSSSSSNDAVVDNRDCVEGGQQQQQQQVDVLKLLSVGEDGGVRWEAVTVQPLQ
jgi:hypothetical protein